MTQKTIYKKLLFWFIVVTLFPLLVASSSTYFSSRSALLKEINNNLITITDSKAEQIETYLQNIKSDVEMLSNMPTIVDTFKVFQSNPEELSEEERNQALKFNAFLTYYFNRLQYKNLILLNGNGEILFNYKGHKNFFRRVKQSVEPGSELADVFERARMLQEVSLSHFFYDSRLKSPSVYISTPVFNQKQIIGVVVVQIDNETFSRTVNDYTGLGLTGETLVGIKTDDQITLVTSTRHNSEAALAHIEPLMSKQLSPLQQAVRGKMGYGTMIDYRDRATLAAWRYLPSIDGGMVVKIDRSEALAAVDAQRNTFILLVTLTTIGVTIAALLVANSIAHPIVYLTTFVQRFAQGHFTEQAPILTQDEIGFLAQAFNQMSTQLHHSFQTLENLNQDLEKRVAERTLDLEKANQEIRHLNEQLTTENLRMSSELEITRQLQQMILPKDNELLKIDFLEIAGFMEPATEIGGDYYDILSDGDRIFIGIGDVTGHGLESGVLMIMVQTAIRTLIASQETNLVKFFDTLNRTIYENVKRINSDKHLTLSLLNYQQGTLTLSGQHEEVIVVRVDGTVERIDTIDLGFPIGLDDDIADFIDKSTIILNSGDIVVLYTDGITEAENIDRVQYGIENLCRVVKKNSQGSAQEIREAVIQDLKQYIGIQTIYDDITLVIIKQK